MKRTTNQIMKRIFLLSLLFSSYTLLPIDKGKHAEPKNKTASIEATVTIGFSGCGYLLRLSNGELIKPVNLPRKFQKPGEKVVLVLDEMKTVYNSPCQVQKEVHISAVHLYTVDPGQKTKY
jgi:hypothetical protein